MRMILIFLTGLSLGLAGCGGESDSATDVIATTPVAADIARELAGPDASVESLLPDNASAHDFGASAKDRAALEDADVVFAWGGGFEAGVPLDGLDPPAIELSGDARDPHVWMDPVAMADRLPRMAAALAEADPERADAYRRRAAAYAERLARLHRRLRRILGAIPAARRKLVTAHDSLGHFARRYGFEIVGTPFGRAPGAEPSAGTVADLIERVKRERVPAVFSDDAADPELVEEIARGAGVRVVDDLLIEGFAGQAESYEEMLLLDARRIAEALAP